MNTETTPQNQLATVEVMPAATSNSAFASVDNFAAAQRMAKLLASSKIIPETYRDNVPDCLIAMEMANRIGANVLAVMQSLYIVYGRPAWSSQFLISCVNASRRFSPLRYKMTGDKAADSWGCIAWAQDSKTGEQLDSPEVTIWMAKAEGWYTKNGSKWKTMPELMLRYRAATLFARLYAPELTMGIHSDDEVVDISPVVTDANPKARAVAPAVRFTATIPQAASGNVEPENPGSAGEASVVSAAPEASKPEPAGPTLTHTQADISEFLLGCGVSFDNFSGWLQTTGRFSGAMDSFADVPDHVCLKLQDEPQALARCVKLYGKAAVK